MYVVINDDDPMVITGLLESSSEIKVYPNPNPGVFTIKVPNELQYHYLEIMDLSGRVLDSRLRSVGKYSFDLKKGVYIIRLIRFDEVVKTSKIVVKY